jgi:type I restriction enzyme S subunit
MTPAAPPNGFKQTEIGLIPEEWNVLKLTNVCQKTKQRTPQADEEFEYIDVSSVSNETFKITGSTHYKGINAPSRARKPVQANDVLFATVRPTLKRVAMVPKHLDGRVCSTAFCVVRANPELSDPSFLYQLLLTNDLNDRISERQRGSSYPAVTDSDVLNQIIPVPPLPEQRAIAHILAKIQAAAEAQAAIAGRARELKRALMAKLFTEGLSGEPLKETEIGMMPEGWEVPELSQVVEIVYGAQAAVANALEPSIGTPILTNINITNDGSIDLSTLRYYKVPENKRERLILRKGDLLFNWRSGSQDHVGKTALFDLDGEYTFASFILRFRTSDKVSNSFLRYYLYHIKSQGFFAQYRQQSSVNSVFNASAAAKIPVVLPSLDEQREIARILQTVDAKIAAAERKRAGLEELFRAMLGELMRGRGRVKGLM